jgi:oligopeptide/dipeptide ABC transporter ATP-binding protein
MYGGYVVEVGPIADVYTAPLHPYTRALLTAIPTIESAGKRSRRAGIPGQPPGLGDIVGGCPFLPRCSLGEPSCASLDVVLEPVTTDHATACPVVVRGLPRAGAGGPERQHAGGDAEAPPSGQATSGHLVES